MLKTMTVIGMATAMCGAALGQDWIETQKLVAADAGEGDALGFDVALDGDTLLTGAGTDDVSFNNDGSAYVFVRDGATWVEQAKLVSSDPAHDNRFGFSVALEGDRAVVSEVRGDGVATNSGCVYVFERVAGVWTQTARLVADDAQGGEWFGFDVALEGDRIVVGATLGFTASSASGSVYVFDFDGSQWHQTQVLEPADAHAGGYFGVSVAIEGDTIVVGADGQPTDAVERGAAYVFQLDGDRWVERQKLVGSSTDARDNFGVSVTINERVILVGADQYGPGVTIERPGAAFAFEVVDGVWVERAIIESEDPDTLRFGKVAKQGNLAVIGASWDESFFHENGAAFVYQREADGTWNKLDKLLPSDPGFIHLFGNEVAIDGDTIACASAFATVDGVLRAGAAYIFEPNPCPADLDGDGSLTIFDFLAFQNAFDAMDPVADFDGDGDFTLFDFLAFQNAFDAGCP